MLKTLLRKETLTKRKERILLYALVSFVILVVFIGFIVSRVNLWQKDLRDSQRVETLEEVVLGIEKLNTENGQYPEAVFFKEYSVMICSKIDCFINQEVELKGSSKGTSDMVNKTNKDSTKYAYELTQDSYKIAFCDEDGKVRNFGKAPFGEDMICE